MCVMHGYSTLNKISNQHAALDDSSKLVLAQVVYLNIIYFTLLRKTNPIIVIIINTISV